MSSSKPYQAEVCASFQRNVFCPRPPPREEKFSLAHNGIRHSLTWPKTTCLPSKKGVGTVQMKNWLPLVLRPALAIERVFTRTQNVRYLQIPRSDIAILAASHVIHFWRSTATEPTDHEIRRQRAICQQTQYAPISFRGTASLC